MTCEKPYVVMYGVMETEMKEERYESKKLAFAAAGYQAGLGSIGLYADFYVSVSYDPSGCWENTETPLWQCVMARQVMVEAYPTIYSLASC